MAPIWFPQCEKSVLAIILSRSKGHDTQSSKIPSYWVGFPYCLNKVIKHRTPELTGPSFASHGRSVLSRGDQLVPSSVSTVFLACGTRASAIYRLSSPCGALRSGVAGSISRLTESGIHYASCCVPQIPHSEISEDCEFLKTTTCRANGGGCLLKEAS